MRQLFVPACLCLMTWSGPATPEPTPSLEYFTGAAAAKAETHAPIQDPVPASVSAPARVSDADSKATTTGTAVAPDAAPVPAPDPETSGTAQDETPDATSDTAALPVAAPVPDAAAAEPDLAIEYPAPGVLALNVVLPETAPLPRRRPPPRPVVHRTPEEICDTLTQAAEENRLPAPFFIRLLFQESRFKPGVVSAAGALGIAQFMPETSASMGVQNPFDPLQAIPASARLLRDLFEQFGNLGLAAAAYNAGPKRIQDWLTKKASLPAETQGYVRTITGRAAESWKKAAAAEHAEQRLPRRAPCQEAAGLYAWDGPEHIPVPTASPMRVAEAARLAEIKSKTAGKAETKTVAKAETKTANKAESKTAKAESKATAKTGNKSAAKAKNKFAGKATGKTTVRSAHEGAVQLAARERKRKRKHSRHH